MLCYRGLEGGLANSTKEKPLGIEEREGEEADSCQVSVRPKRSRELDVTKSEI